MEIFREDREDREKTVTRSDRRKSETRNALQKAVTGNRDIN